MGFTHNREVRENQVPWDEGNGDATGPGSKLALHTPRSRTPALSPSMRVARSLTLT